MDEYDFGLLDAELERRGMNYDGGETLAKEDLLGGGLAWYWQRSGATMALQVLDEGDRYGISIMADADDGTMLVDDYSVPRWYLRPEASEWAGSVATTAALWAAWSYANIFAGYRKGKPFACGLVRVDDEWLTEYEYESGLPMERELGYVPRFLLDTDAPEAVVSNEEMNIVNPLMDDSGRWEVPLTYYDDAIMAAYHQAARS